jgi:hypothetical protein
LYLTASVPTMMPAPHAWSARDSTVSPMTGMRGLRPTIIFAPHLVDA